MASKRFRRPVPSFALLARAGLTSRGLINRVAGSVAALRTEPASPRRGRRPTAHAAPRSPLFSRPHTISLLTHRSSPEVATSPRSPTPWCTGASQPVKHAAGPRATATSQAPYSSLRNEGPTPASKDGPMPTLQAPREHPDTFPASGHPSGRGPHAGRPQARRHHARSRQHSRHVTARCHK